MKVCSGQPHAEVPSTSSVDLEMAGNQQGEQQCSSVSAEEFMKVVAEACGHSMTVNVDVHRCQDGTPVKRECTRFKDSYQMSTWEQMNKGKYRFGEREGMETLEEIFPLPGEKVTKIGLQTTSSIADTDSLPNSIIEIEPPPPPIPEQNPVDFQVSCNLLPHIKNPNDGRFNLFCPPCVLHIGCEPLCPLQAPPADREYPEVITIMREIIGFLNNSIWFSTAVYLFYLTLLFLIFVFIVWVIIPTNERVSVDGSRFVNRSKGSYLDIQF